ncbi:MAG: lipoate--protein ligase [Firmicutes bacterium]|nr:lipoate--protein ligase [Bacillota bacterium]
MIYIESASTNPYYNLALEEFAFERMDRSQSVFMLWQNDNTIVVGKYQNTAEEINQEFVDAQGIRVVRRLSGGGAVYHDKGNLNFTFIADQKQFADFNFRVFTKPVLQALEELGVHASFSGRNDLVLDGKKFSGNSQYAHDGRVLHHGCIMLDSNLDKVKDALRVRDAKFTSRSVKSVRSRVTTINEHAPRRISMEEFKDALKKQVFAENDITEYTLTEADQEAVLTLMHEKYETWGWNYGFTRAYSLRREQKFDGGLVTVDMNVEHGVITEIRFSGDFFGSGDLKELEQALEGIPLDGRLARRLEELGMERCIHGISAADIALLLM